MKRCTAKSKRTGQPCGAWAVRGYSVCKVHGAGTRKRVLNGTRKPVAPLTSPAVQRYIFGPEVEAIAAEVESMSPEERAQARVILADVMAQTAARIELSIKTTTTGKCEACGAEYETTRVTTDQLSQLHECVKALESAAKIMQAQAKESRYSDADLLRIMTDFFNSVRRLVLNEQLSGQKLLVAISSSVCVLVGKEPESAAGGSIGDGGALPQAQG